MGLGFDRKYCRSSTSRGEREKTLNQWHYRLLNWATTSLQNHLKIQTDRFPKIWISKIDDQSSTYFVNVQLVILAPSVIIQKVKELLKDQFAETGTGSQLYEKYGLSHNHIVNTVKATLNKK